MAQPARGKKKTHVRTAVVVFGVFGGIYYVCVCVFVFANVLVHVVVVTRCGVMAFTLTTL